MLGSFKNWNIIKISNKATSSEDLNKINQVVLDGIRNNIAALVQTGKYGAINTIDTNTMGYYFIKLLSENYTLQ